jgi:tryptophan synthase alpha chain
MTAGGSRIESSLRRATAAGRPSLAAFLTAGFPSADAFASHVRRVAQVADVIEIGVPFSDPMADGVTIQRASRVALEGGVTLASILEEVAAGRGTIDAPIVLMSYLNPLLAYGVARLAADAAAAGVSGFIVPDLPLEEQEVLAEPLRSAGIALIQLVTPATTPQRAARIAGAAEGFLYAVAINGTTGSSGAGLDGARSYLQRVLGAARCPVLAGFGVRTRNDIARLVPPAHGVIVGSALIEAIERGQDPAAFLEEIRP